MTMRLSSADLSRILSQPGYAIGISSGLARTGGIGSEGVNGCIATPKPKQPVLWRSERFW